MPSFFGRRLQMLQQNLPIELPPVTAVLMGTDKFYDALRSLIWEKDEKKTGCSCCRRWIDASNLTPFLENAEFDRFVLLHNDVASFPI